jgi:hypothetical protein
VSLNGVGTVDYNKNKNARFQNIISLVADILDKAKLKEKEKTDILSFLSSLLSNISSNKSMTQMFKFERSDFVWKEGTVDLEFRGVLSTGEVVIAKSNVQVKK